MGQLTVDISMSLDGFIDAAKVTPAEPMGVGGEILHQWLADMDDVSAGVLERGIGNTGAVICGRRTYDLSVPFWQADGPSGPARRPVIVLSHSHPDQVPPGGVYSFVSGGPKEALDRAREAAGDLDVTVMGGANVIQQFLAAGLVDVISVHLVPVLLGAGNRLFDLDLPSQLLLEHERVDVSPNAIHLLFHARAQTGTR